MTTQIISRFFGLLASTLVVVNSFAQVSEFKNLQPSLINGSSVKVYQHIEEEFQKQFAGAENVRWSKVDKNFLSTFTINDQEFKTLFTPKAILLYKISYGKEKHLPVGIRKAVKRVYVEFVITSAIKVEEADRIIWVINLEDDTNLVSVRVENDEIEQTQKYTKFNPKPAEVNIARQ
jgi:hypothetical protein